MINFKINFQETHKFTHYWEMCVGSSHAYTALRADYREQLKKAHDELGFKYVRFHGLFDDEMSVCTETFDFEGNSQGIIYNFTNIDNIIDFLLEINMKPFLELGFMPNCLTSGKGQVFPYGGNNSMPKSDLQWQELVTQFVKHLVERYGLVEVKSWFFEVWNEPNLPLFFSGSQEDYFHLYEITANSIKKVNPELKVGGPATSFNSWISEFIEFCEGNSVPLDFVSTHHYPTDDPLWKSGMDIEEYFKQNQGIDSRYPRGVLKKMTLETKKQAKNYPLYYTEWNVSAELGDDIHDDPYAAAMVAKTLADNDGLVDGYSYWTFSDIFEEQYQKPNIFHGGFGLQTYQGIEKPVYRIFEIFHELGNERLKVENSEPDSTVELVSVRNENDLQLLLYNHNVPDEPISEHNVTIDLNNVNLNKECFVKIIDENHANAKKRWIDLGSPEYVNSNQIKELHVASELQSEKVKVNNGMISLDVEPHSCVYITINNFFN